MNLQENANQAGLRTVFVNRVALAGLIAVLLGIAPLSAHAADAVWNILSGAGPHSWNANASWTPNTTFPNGIGQRAQFNVNFATANTVINLNIPIIVGRMDVGDTTNTFRAVTFAPGTSGTLTFDSSSGNAILTKASTASAVTDTISAPIILNDNLDATNNAANAPIVISGNITESGTRNINKLGVGTITLSGANSYTGTTTVSAGTLTVTAPSVLYGGIGGWTSANVLVNSGALLNLSYDETGSSNFSDANIVTLSGLTGYAAGSFLGLDTTAGSVSITSSISNANVILTKTGANTLTLGSSASNNIKTAVRTGTLLFTNRSNLFAANTANWTDTNFGVTSGATAQFNVGAAGEFTAADIATLGSLGTSTGGFLNGSTLAVDTTNATADTTVSNPILNANSMGLTKLGSNKLILAAANTYSGPTTLALGELTVSHSLALQNSAYSNTGGTFAFGSGVTSATIGALAGSTSLTLTNDASNPVSLTVGNSTGTFSGQLIGTTTLTKSGSGTQTFSGSNTSSFNGTTLVNAGVMNYASNDAIGSVDSSGTDAVITVNSGGTAAAAYTFGIDQSFLGRVVNTSTGVVALNSASANSLDFSASGANMAVTSLGAAGAFTYTGTLTPNGNVYRLGGGTSNANLTMGTPLAVGNSLILDVNGTSASSTVTLNQANAHDLGTTLNSGTVVVANSAAFGTGPLTLNGGKIDGFSTGAAITYAVTNNIVANGTTKIRSQGTSTGTNATLTFTGAVTGSGTLSFDNEGVTGHSATINLNGDLSGFNGIVEFNAIDTTTITGIGAGGTAVGNTLALNSPSVSGVNDYSNVRFVAHGATNNASNGRSLRIGDSSLATGPNVIKLGDLSGDGGLLISPSFATTDLVNNRRIYEVGSMNLNSSFAGGFRELGPADVVKTGTGSWTISGRSVHAGSTTVRSGALILAGDAITSNLSSSGDNSTTDGLFLNSFDATDATDKFVPSSTVGPSEAAGTVDTLANGTPVMVANVSALGAPGTAATVYYVVNSTGSGLTQSFSIAATPGGPAINIGTAAGVRVYPFGSVGSGFAPIELGDTGSSLGHTATLVSQPVSLLTGGAVTIDRAINVNNVGAGSTIGGNTDNTSTFSRPIVLSKNVDISQVATTGANSLNISGVISSTGTFGVRKVGAGKATLSGLNTYTGDTTVQAGTLSITNDDTLADLADLYLTTGSFLNLSFVGIDTIDSLFIDAGIQASGIWGAVGSGAAHESALLTGSGLLSITTGASLQGDYNGNGTVDAADYVLWRKDPTNVGGGNPTGYNTWRANFGKPPGSGSGAGLGNGAVPEPAALAMLMIAILGLLSGRPIRGN